MSQSTFCPSLNNLRAMLGASHFLGAQIQCQCIYLFTPNSTTRGTAGLFTPKVAAYRRNDWFYLKNGKQTKGLTGEMAFEESHERSGKGIIKGRKVTRGKKWGCETAGAFWELTNIMNSMCIFERKWRYGRRRLTVSRLWQFLWLESHKIFQTNCY